MGKSKKEKKRNRSSSSASDCGNCKKLAKRMERLETLVTKNRSKSPSRHSSRGRTPRRRYSRSTSRSRDRLPRPRHERSRSRSFRSVVSRNRASRSPSRLSLSVLHTPDASRRSTVPTLPDVTSNPEEADSAITKTNGEDRDDILVLDNDIVLPDDILKILGEDPNKEENTSFLLHDQLARIWQSILANGLKKTEVQTLLNTHQLPKNLVYLKPPELNPEVKAATSKQSVSVDASYAEMQAQIGKGLSALGNSISTILLHLENVPEQFKAQFLTNLCDS